MKVKTAGCLCDCGSLGEGGIGFRLGVLRQVWYSCRVRLRSVLAAGSVDFCIQSSGRLCRRSACLIKGFGKGLHRVRRQRHQRCLAG